jgi:hypothetical protein
MRASKASLACTPIKQSSAPVPPTAALLEATRAAVEHGSPRWAAPSVRQLAVERQTAANTVPLSAL